MNNFIEMFSGIGGMGYGLMQAGWNCVGYAEIDKYAHQAYKILHDPENRMWNAYDVKSVTDDDLRLLGSERGPIELIAAGFPCQSFSIAGKRQGFTDATRGTLFFEIIRWASILRPEHLLLENVTGLLNHDEGRTFQTVIGALDELGYVGEWCVLNSAAYVPQNRERIFIVASLRGSSRPKIFPFGAENSESAEIARECILIDDQGRTTKELRLLDTCPTLRAQSHGNEPKVLVVGNTNPSGNGMNGQVYDAEYLAPTLTTNKGEGNKVLVNVSQITGIKETDNAACLDANYFKGLGCNQARTGVMEITCINPRKEDGTQTYQQDRVYDTNGVMTTLSAELAGRFNIITEVENEKLQGMRKGNNKGSSNDVLQPRVHESQFQRTENNNGSELVYSSPMGEGNQESGDMRSLQFNGEPGRSSQGRKLEERGSREPSSVMQELPHSDTQSEDLHNLRSEAQGQRILREAPSAVQEIRESIPNQTKYRIRKLTPLECMRLQSYPDEWYVILKLFRYPELISLVDMSRNDITAQVTALIGKHHQLYPNQMVQAKEGMSDSQLYKMAGNGVTSSVAYEIGKRLDAKHMDGGGI